LFDFNGTMFFDEEFQNKSWKSFLVNKLNREISDIEMEKMVHGVSSSVSLRYFFNENLSEKEVFDLEEEKEKIYRSLCLKSDGFRLADGLEFFLDQLKQEKIEMNIATASGLNNTAFFFKHLQLDRWFCFDKVIYNDGNIKSKPDPECYLKAAEAINSSINECIIFEDSKSGIIAGKKANAKAIIGVASMQKKERLLELGADYAIDDYTNLEKLMKLVTV